MLRKIRKVTFLRKTKTYDFTKHDKFVKKIAWSYKNAKFANTNWKGIISKKKGNLICWQGLVLLDWPWQVRTCPKSEFWCNLAHFWSKTDFLTKCLNDSAWFCLEKLKKTRFWDQKPLKIIQNPEKYNKNEKHKKYKVS